MIGRLQGNADLEGVPGADHSWGTVPHLHQSALGFLRYHLNPG